MININFGSAVDLKKTIPNLICFLFFSLFLIFRVSYTATVVLTLIFSLFVFKDWTLSLKNKEIKYLFFYFVVLAVVWSHSFDGLLSWSNEGDYFIRYGLASVFILAVGFWGVDKRFLSLGLALGATLAGIYALWQFPILGRAEGYTNAIRFGNIALLMSVFLIIFSIAEKKINSFSVFLFIAAVMGLVASFLSLSRGGWVFLLLLPFIIIILFDDYKNKVKAMLLLAGFFILAIIIFFNVDFLQTRMLLVQKEVVGYFSDKENFVTTSVGARLEQWQLSWKLGLEKPIFGWGDVGIDEGRRIMVARGEAHPTALSFPHTHHELLEMWATRGIVGVVFIIFVYLVPAWIFYPAQKKLLEFKVEHRGSAKALYLAGFCIPVSYFVFGLTDVFFNLSNGHVFMIFSIIFIMASIQRLKHS